MNNEKTQIDIKSYWAILSRRKTLIVIPLMIVPLVAFLITYFMTPTYVSSVTILLNDLQVLPITVERDFEGRRGFEYGRITLGEREISYRNQITSTKYLRRLIATMNIPITESIKKIVASTKANYPQISENDLAENILANQIRKNVAVEMTANNLIEVSFTSSDPVAAQMTAAALADIFIEENLAAELAGVTSSIAFSDEQLAFYKEKLKNAEDKLRNYRTSLLTSSFGEDTTGVTLREVSVAVQTLDLDISNQQDIQAALRTRLDQENVDMASISLPAPVTAKRDKLLNTASRLSDLLASYDWRDIRIYSLNEEARNLIVELTNDIGAWVEERFPNYSQELRSLIGEYFTGNIKIDFNRAKRAILDQYILKAKTMVGEDPATEITMARLQSEINSYERFYDLFVSHSQNAAISQSAKKVEAEAKFTIIRAAPLPLSPDSPNRIRILGMGIALGLMIGVGAIMLVELLDNSFKKVEDVTEHLQLPVIGTIPRMEIPFSDTGKRKVPIAIGVSVSFILVLLIIFLNFKRNG
ncbi:MAG: hypothetical protein A2W25_02635 [candidate division Zixibacteria bacterium RBG_16_53_22]|nr:MAG: hypothetical protein A2W25_02635 [candidate division Zixibacteria bacterium RBG_16_53_22]